MMNMKERYSKTKICRICGMEIFPPDLIETGTYIGGPHYAYHQKCFRKKEFFQQLKIKKRETLHSQLMTGIKHDHAFNIYTCTDEEFQQYIKRQKRRIENGRRFKQ